MEVDEKVENRGENPKSFCLRTTDIAI